jgi:hypothetical protein
MKVGAFGKWLVLAVILSYILLNVDPSAHPVRRVVGRLSEIRGNLGRLDPEKHAIMKRFRNFEEGARRLMKR